MGSTRAHVLFDKTTAQFNPGEKINGKVLFFVEREKRILGIDLLIIGKAKASTIISDREVTRRGHMGLSSYWDSYGDKYFIFKECKPLIRECETESKMLPVGIYEYPFNWTLPENIPSSFEGPYGWIRYRTEVIVRHSFWDHKCEAEADFYVHGFYDLNNLDRIYRVVQVENKWLHFTDCYGEVYLDLTLELERSAYAPGESIKFAVTIDFKNDSGHPPIPGVKVALIQEQTYRAKGEVKQYFAKISEVTGPITNCLNIEVWNGVIPVPFLTPTSLGGACRIIDVQYFLRTTLDISDVNNIDHYLKLQIGTVGIKRVRHRNRQNSRDRTFFPEYATSVEYPEPDTVSIYENGQGGQATGGLYPADDFLSVTPGPSRRSSASLALDLYIPPPSAPLAFAEEMETPPPSYSEALFMNSFGVLQLPTNSDHSGENLGAENDDPPSYPLRKPPAFKALKYLRRAKNLFDSHNVYPTL